MIKTIPMTKKDWLPVFVVWAAFVLVAGAFLSLVGNLAWHGASLLSWDFFVSSPLKSGRVGGIGPILLSTAWILLVCMAVSLPLGLGTAIFLSEVVSAKSLFGRFVLRSLDVLSGVPSIVFGLFGNAVFCKAMGLGFSILSGGLTLSCMVLPLLIRSTEEGFRAVPDHYRLSSAALGVSKLGMLRHVLLPMAIPGLVVGMVLGIGRALAETAALIFTSGYVDRWPTSLLDSGRALSVHIFDLSMNVTGGDIAAYKSSLVLVLFLALINGAATSLARSLLKRRTERK